MGVDYTIYLGPFLKCKNIKGEVDHTIRTCTNKSCHKREYWDKNKQFCEQCGSPIGNITTKVKRNLVDTDPCIVKEALVPYTLDANNVKGFVIWIANKRRKIPGREFSFDPREGEQYEEVSTGMIMDEIQEFQEQYKEAIDKLKELYGKKNVEVKWGLINEIN